LLQDIIYEAAVTKLFSAVHKVDITAVCLSFRLARNLSDGFKEGFPTCLPAGRRASLAGMTGSFVVQVIYGMTPFNLKKAVNHSQK